MRADRLMAILFALQGGATVTARELAERLEVSTRTVTRDLEALGASGVPVFAERGYGGGWRLAEGFRARFNGLKRDDLERLLLSRTGAAKLFADLGREREFQETWEKLLATASSGHASGEAASVRDRIHIDGAGWRDSFEALPFLPTLYDAVWAGRKVTMRYGAAERAAAPEAASGRGGDASESFELPERELCPLGLVAKGSVWYVVGRTGGEIRTFRVSRFREVRDQGEPFERPADFDLAAYWTASMRTFRERLPSYVAILRLTAEARELLAGRRYVRMRVVSGDASSGGADGVMTVEADFETETYAAEQILALACHGFGAEVLAPASLKAALRSVALRLADMTKE